VQKSFEEWCEVRKEIMETKMIKEDGVIKEKILIIPEIEEKIIENYNEDLISKSELTVKHIYEDFKTINPVVDDLKDLSPINTDLFKERPEMKIIDCHLNKSLECLPILTQKEIKIDDQPVFLGDRYLKYNDLSKLLFHISKCVIVKNFKEALRVSLEVVENNKNAYYVKLLVYIGEKFGIKDKIYYDPDQSN